MFLKFKALFLLVVFGLTAMAGTITPSVSTLPTYGNCPIFWASSPQYFTISGTSLTGNIIVSTPTDFEVSLNHHYGYADTLQIAPNNGSVSNIRVFVRFSPQSTGSKSGNVVCASVGSSNQNIGVSGMAVATTTTSSTYYNTISTTAIGSTLKTALYNKILGHVVTAYGSGSSGLWATYPTTDPLYNGKVWDIYSTKLDGPSPYQYTFSINQCGNYSVEGDCYNREHSFPQSWFTSSSPMVSDMFHVYPTDGKVNGMRNNYPFGEVSSPTFNGLQGGKLGANTTSGYSGIVFEPIDEYKGDLARSFFYMATRYENLIAGWQNNGNANDVLAGNAFPVFDQWHLDLLIKWHNQDPPSVKEINRNNAIFGYQTNRNPFIDSPQYVNKIWGGAKAFEPTLAATNFYKTGNTANSVSITWKNGNGNRRVVVARAGSPVNSLPIDSITYLASSVFGSGAQIGNGNFVVYDGMGCKTTVTNLNQTTVYYFTVIEYNGTNITANYLTNQVLNSGMVALPVTWLKVWAEPKNDDEININWQTASEVNNSFFTVEFLNNNVWEAIGIIGSSKNSRSVKSYTFTHKISNLNLSTFTYRIKQTDLDGNSNYSKTVSVKVGLELNKEITVSPNPFSNYVILNGLAENQTAEIFVYDIQGAIKMHQLIKQTDEKSVKNLDALHAGIYFVTIVQQSGKQTIKIVKNQ